MVPTAHTGFGMPVGHISGGQLLPSETAKLENFQEEVKQNNIICSSI